MKAEMKKWIDFVHEIGNKQAELFLENNISYMECLVNGISFKNLLTVCYNALLRQKKIVQIEYLPIEEKQRLFEIVKEFDNSTLDKEGYVLACRSLYALEQYLKIKP